MNDLSASSISSISNALTKSSSISSLAMHAIVRRSCGGNLLWSIKIPNGRIMASEEPGGSLCPSSLCTISLIDGKSSSRLAIPLLRRVMSGIPARIRRGGMATRRCVAMFSVRRSPLATRRRVVVPPCHLHRLRGGSGDPPRLLKGLGGTFQFFTPHPAFRTPHLLLYTFTAVDFEFFSTSAALTSRPSLSER